MTLAVDIEPLTPDHDRSTFDSGVPALDRYLQEQASQDTRRRISNCFVAVEHGASAIAGFYTLAASSMPVTEIPPNVARQLLRYPVVPAVLLGRLAVIKQWRGKGLGAALVADAVRRSASSDAAVFAILVDAKDKGAAAFYEHLGFTPFQEEAKRLFLPIATALKLLD